MSETSSVPPAGTNKPAIAENLKRLLDERGMQAKALALHIGVSPQAFSHWATGQLIPSAKRLRQIAEVLGVSIDELTRPHDATLQISIDKIDLQLEPLSHASSASDRLMEAGKWSPSLEMRLFTAITMKDDNLEPHIHVGDDLFVDLTWRGVSLSGVYLLDIGGFPIFRRCHLVSAEIVHVSDCNVQQELKPSDLFVLGRAVKLLTRP